MGATSSERTIVAGRDDQRLEIGRLLEAVEGSPPIDAVDVLAAELRRLVDARHVSLLISNLSGNAVVRLSHVTAGQRRDDGRNERAESLHLPGTIYEQVLFSQECPGTERSCRSPQDP
jgi:hypothetical protein